MADRALSRADYNSLADDDFRRLFGECLANNYPAHLRQDAYRPFRRLRGDDASNWLKLLHRHGWRAPGWPKEYGGMGLTFRKQLIYQQELERASVARIIDLGETQLGPTLIACGNEAQKAHYLPRILACEDIWCQGYSEPNAGSDLASLRTQAVLDGDEFVVNGQKIWTTQANESTHIFTLVRTGKYPKKQLGISFLLIDLRSPGVVVRPIMNLAGEDEFCEVFFENVRVPRENLVGEFDQGWRVAKALLGHERIWIGSPALAGKALGLAQRLLEETGAASDMGTMDRFAQLSADLHDYRAFYSEICDRMASEHRQPEAEVSALKVYASELLQRICECNYEVAGADGGVVGEVKVGTMIADLHWQFMMSRPVTIFAGANEIQRDILARAVLKMPTVPIKQES